MFKDCGSYFIYVPEEYTGPLDVAVYYPGAGGAGSLSSADALPWVDYVNTNPNQIVIINKGVVDNSATIYGDLNKSSLNIGKVNVYCHSLGDVAGLQTAVNGPQYGFDVNFLSVMDSNAQLNKYKDISPEEAQTLADSGTTVVLFNQRDWAMDANRTKPLTDAGVPLMYITCKTDVSNIHWDETNHALINAQPIQNGYPDLLTGTIDSLPIEPTATRGAHHIIEYEFNWFDYDKNSWVKLTKSEAEAILLAQGQSLSDYIPSTLPYNINNGSLVNISASDIEFNLDVAIGSLPSSDNLLVYRDELSAFLSSSMLSSLSNDASEANGLNSLISSFMTNTILKGDSWNMAYSKLGIYNEKLNARAAAAIELGDTLRNAISQLLGCMGEYDKIDTSELPELKATLEQLKSDLEILKSQLMKEVTYTDSKGDRYTKSEEDPEVRRRINEVNEEIAEIEKLIKVIEKLQATYNSVRPQLEAALAKVSEFSHEVASIEPSQVYTYVA